MKHIATRFSLLSFHFSRIIAEIKYDKETFTSDKWLRTEHLGTAFRQSVPTKGKTRLQSRSLGPSYYSNDRRELITVVWVEPQ